MNKNKDKASKWPKNRYNNIIIFLIRQGILKTIILLLSTFFLIIGILYFKVIPEVVKTYMLEKIYITAFFIYLMILIIIYEMSKTIRDARKIRFIIKEFKIKLEKDNFKNQILDCIKFKELIYNNSQEAIEKVRDLYKGALSEKIDLEIMEVKIRLKQDKSVIDIISVFAILISTFTLFFNFVKESIPDGIKTKLFQDMLPAALIFFLVLIFSLVTYIFIKAEDEEIFKFKKYVWELKLSVLEKVKEAKKDEKVKRIIY